MTEELTRAAGGGTADRRARLVSQLSDSMIDTSDSMSSGTVLLLGSVGTGKTTFAQQLAISAEQIGARIGWGVAGEFAGTPPLWTWSQAVSTISSDNPFADHQVGGSEAAPMGTQHAALYQSVAQWLHDQSQESPVLIVLEDLHEADSSTLALFRYLSRRPRRGRWLVVGTSRRQLDDAAQLRCRIHHLEGIDADEIALAARSTGIELDLAAAMELHERTNGNPLFVRRLLEHSSSTSASAPDLLAVIRAELTEMPPDLTRVAGALSVLGSSSDIDLVAEIADIDRLSAAAAVDGDTLIRDDQSLSFSHALLREVVYDGLTEDRRGDLHQRAAEALTHRSESPVRVAHHLRRASDHHHGATAAHFATEAGRWALSAGAFAEAIEHCTAAVRAHERRADDADEEGLADALLLQARALSYSGQVAAAEKTLTAAVHLHTELSTASKMRLVREFIRLRWREEPSETSLTPERLIKLASVWLDDADAPDERAMFHLAMFGAAEIRGLELDDLDTADAALAAADESGDHQLIGEAHLARRRALMSDLTALDERRSATRNALTSAALIDDAELVARARRMAISDAVAACDRTEALALEKSMDAMPTAGLREHEALWRCGLATLEGRRADAEAILDNASLELSYLGVEAPSLTFVRAIFGLDAGGLREALAEFEPLLPVVADPLLDAAFAFAAVQDDDLDRANELLARAVASLAADSGHLLWPLSVCIGAEAAAAIGHDSAEQFLDMLLPLAGQASCPAAATVPWVGAYDRYIGLLQLRLGHDDDAVRSLTESLRLHRSMRANPWIARSHAALGVALDRVGRSEEAERHRGHAQRLQDEFSMGDVLIVGDYTTTPTIAPAVTSDAVFVRDGATWSIGFGDALTTYRDLAGLNHLHRLISDAGNDWHALDLYGLGATAPGTTVVEGSAGPVLDDEARRQYRERYLELSAAREEAEQFGDFTAADRASDEIDELEAAIINAFGLGGRSRQLDDPAERARINVRRAISRAINTINDSDPTMADHLRHRVSTGRFCAYTPDRSRRVEWTTH